MFGKRGRDYLARVELPAGAQELLRQDLTLLEAPSREVRTTEQWLRDSVRGDHRVELLRTVAGLGDLLATVVALEIDRIERFASAASWRPTLVWFPPPIPRAARPSTAS
jgi:hypothetical protein